MNREVPVKKNAFGPRRAFLFFVVVCLLAAAAGCGADGQPGGEDELPELVIASDSYEPYHYIEANGDHAGIDVELAREACSRLGYRPVFLDIAWEDKDSYLEKGLADCLWGCFTMTGREQDYQWAGPYLVSRQTVLVRADSGIGRGCIFVSSGRFSSHQSRAFSTFKPYFSAMARMVPSARISSKASVSCRASSSWVSFRKATPS